MAEPTLASVHVDQALTDQSIAYFQGANNIATSVFPTVASARQSNKYHIYDKADTLRSDAQKRAPGTEAAVRTYALSQDSFFCDVYSVAVDVSEQVAANADPVLDPEEDAARLTVDDLITKMETDFASVALSSGVWATDLTSTGSLASTGLFPRIATAHKTIEAATGRKANTLTLTADVWYDGLMNNADIIARLPDNDPRFVTESFIARVFDVDRVFVLRRVQASGDEGSTGVSYNYVKTNKALLTHTPSSPGPRTPSAGYTFTWAGLTGAGNDGIRTKRMDMPWKDALPRVETDAAWDFKVTGTDLGYLFADPI